MPKQDSATFENRLSVATDIDVPADILVVDDNAANILAVEAALGDLGKRIVRAESGEQALRHLLAREFALILLDVQMPRMDGFETAQIIRSRERSRHVPIIFVTAFGRNDEEVLRGYRLGAVDFLFKPIVPEVLRAKAQVFVELQERTAMVRRQAQQLREFERRELEQRLVAERERWEIERLTEEGRRKDEFLAVLAHELRNPLSPIATGLDLIDAYGIEHDGLNQIRGSMERQLTHLIRLVDDLLDISRISSGKIVLQQAPVRIACAVERAVESLKSRIDEKRHSLGIKGDADVVAYADPVRLTQIIGNLLNNAIRYTAAEGEIGVSWSVEDEMAVVRVADNGKGIAKEMQQSIFDQFVQEESHGSGLGLGLALVKRLVELHGGWVEVASAGRGRGSEFAVAVPLSSAQVAEVDLELDQGGEQPHLRIALVEDDDDVRESVGELLRKWGHEVRAVSSGEEGIELILAWQPDLAIVDIAMPDTNGYTVARKVRESVRPEMTRLAAMTGFGREEDRDSALSAGFDFHITKPARPTGLIRIIREVKGD